MESYEDIILRMQEKFKELAGFQADDASDVGIRLKVLAGEIFSACSNIEWLKNQVFPQTATEKQLDYHAQQRGLERKQAAKSTGILTFSRDTALLYDVNIPVGTICSTAGDESIRFVTTKKGTLSAGSFSVDVQAQAETGGKSGNVLAQKITVMVTPPPGISKVTNSSAFTGGTQEESDDELRERIIESYKNIPNGTNAAFYKNLVLEYPGISSVSVITKARGTGTVDIYAAAVGGAPSDEVLADIQAELNSLKEINVDVEVNAAVEKSCSVYVNVLPDTGYIFEDVKEACVQSINEYFDSLDIGQDFLLAGVGNALYNTTGVKNYSILTSRCSDISMEQKEIGVAGTISILEWS